MKLSFLGSALLIAPALFAGCFTFVETSACSSRELTWVNAPVHRNLFERMGRPAYDPVLDPGAHAGVAVRGEQRFSLNGAGRHLLEVFLANPEADRFTFTLTAAGKPLDARPLIAPGPGRLRPKRGLRHTSLIALVDLPFEFAVTSDAPEYVLTAVRWTPVTEFDKELAPKWLERARELRTKWSAGTARRNYLQQLGDRLAFSSDPAVSNEALLDRTRAWFWLAAENHEPDDLLQTARLFEEGLKRIPRNPILRQMISASCSGQLPRMPEGEFCRGIDALRWSIDLPAAPTGAPKWAVTQRNLMRRMDAITRWWVETRQAPDGQLGGGWGDDVEILRYWGPQALGFGSSVAARGVLNVAGGLWDSGTLLHGYDRPVSDVEHSSEPTTDTQPLAAALCPADAAIRSRLKQTADCADHWLKPQPDGALRFRSSWFNCREADTSEDRAVDVHLNVRAIGPAMWHAYLTRDKHVTALLARWADSWIRAMRQTEHGKPAGIIPSVMRSRDGTYLIGSNGWDKPEAEWDYFQWRAESQEGLTSLFLAVYDLTGNREYLDAATESFSACASVSSRYCDEIRKAPSAFYTWRKISGDNRYDAAFGYKPADDKQILATMTRQAREAEERFSRNWDILTTEALYTDRVYYPLPAEYRQFLFGGEAPRGDRYPTFAVTWPETPVEFARAVLDSSDTTVKLKVYGFDSKLQQVPIRLWRLRPGKYSWKAGERSGEFAVERQPHDLQLPLPPHQETTVEIRQAGR